jgi:hypothetical protein
MILSIAAWKTVAEVVGSTPTQSIFLYEGTTALLLNSF